jgi:hypothetical protein
VVIAAGVAHVLTWVVALFLMFGPVYQGVSETVATPGGVAVESTRVTSTLVEVNGLRVLPFLLAPVALTALALLAALITGVGFARRRVLLWVSSVLLLGACAVAIFSIGLFYLPAAVALIVSAVAGSRRTLVREGLPE